MKRVNSSARSDSYGSRFERQHSAVLANAVPWISIVLASIIPTFALATALPVIPPLGFIVFLSWRMVRPGLLPVWAGVPFGLVDDLFNGQPFGFAILFWSLAMIALEALENWFPWRSFMLDWITSAIMILFYIFAAIIVSGAVLSAPLFLAAVPQMLFSVLAVPVAARLVGALDRVRLYRWRMAR